MDGGLWCRRLQTGRGRVEQYIHQENIALLKKRLAEPHTELERTVLLKLLAAEEARELRLRVTS